MLTMQDSCTPRPRAAIALAMTAGAVLAFGAILLLHVLHSGMHGASQLSPALAWLRDSVLALPLALAAVHATSGPRARAVAARIGLVPQGAGPAIERLGWALLGAAAFAVVTVPAGAVYRATIAGAHAGHGGQASSPFVPAAADAAVVLAGGFVLLAAFAAALGTPWSPRRLSVARPRSLGLALAVQAAAILAAVTASGSTGTPAADAAPLGCVAATSDRSYDVAAIDLQIPMNRWGDRLEHGRAYVLQGDKAAVRNWHRPVADDPANDPAGNRRLRPRPLVLRANAGECVEVRFTNELGDNVELVEGLPAFPRASMHVQGPSYSARTSDGGAVGFNEDTTVANHDLPETPEREDQITYYWRVPDEEGLYLFRDDAVPAGTEHDAGTLGFGLFGALAVEPAGSTWTDPVSGKPLYTGTGEQSGELYIDADITPPSGKSFRESIQLSWDEIPQIGFGFNYGAEPDGNRNSRRCGDCLGEETSLSSWTYGDPGLVKLASGLGPWLPDPAQTDPALVEDCRLPDTELADGRRVPTSCYTANVTHTYVGDPTKVRYAHVGAKETHVFHMHAHQWLADPDDVGAAVETPTSPGPDRVPESVTIDSQTYGPGEAFTANLLFGAGSKGGTFGDSIFHCHLYPHFAHGFWALLRVHDVREDGTGSTPDGVGVRNLEVLPDRTAPAQPTADNPGFPRFIPGKFGWRAPQPPGSITTGGPEGEPAVRAVAGQELTEAETAVERAVVALANGGKEPVPGAPFADPCPVDARQVTYNVSAIQTDIVYNEAGWHDTQGRMLVLDEDVDDIRAGRKEPEPLFIRVNVGDCINFRLTNLLPNWIGGDAFVKLAQTNMTGGHIHLVKFDVLASDGSSNGWNYQQAAFSKDQADFQDAVLAGEASCTQESCRLPDPAEWDASEGRVFPGQTIHERWYADYELRTVFTHDHHFAAIAQNRGHFGALVVEPDGFDVRDPESGEYMQPINDADHGPVCGTACEGDAAGAIVDMVGPGPADDFREFGLAVQDFVTLTERGGDPRNPDHAIAAPGAPETFPENDPGVMGINYRNAPFVLRDRLAGRPVDPAYKFSSWVWGDPATPLLEAYAGDRVEVRLIQGSQEEQHVFAMHGARWRNEPDDPGASVIAAKGVGISEAFNFKLSARVDCAADDIDPCFTDHLYGGTATDDLAMGMWGLMRVYGKRTDALRPLPDNMPAAETTAPMPDATGEAPPVATRPGSRCIADAPVRRFHVVAMETELVYNGAGDHDPYGLIYALAEDEAAIRAGEKKPEPLVIRANEGDCIEVRLTNKLTEDFLEHDGIADGDPTLPLEGGRGPLAGLRVSLHPQLLEYDVKGSDGATAGFNKDQTVGPGQTILYRWYADDAGPGELGAINLTDYGDVRGHRHHGLFAGLVIEPRGATYHDPYTGEQIRSGASADIRVPGRPDFREFVPFFQDGLNLRREDGTIIEQAPDHPPTPEEPAEELDAEDQGEKGFNYASEAFEHRLPDHAPTADEWAHVFDSRRHGDPATPIFRAYAGDPVRVRLLQGGDKPRQHAFVMNGHSWKSDPEDAESQRIAAQGGFSVGRAANIHLHDAGQPGDYRYNCALFGDHQSGGLWGIMRVYPQPTTDAVVSPSPLRDVDDPMQEGYRPLMRLEQAQISASAFDDADASGDRDPGEAGLADVEVRLETLDGTLLERRQTDESGRAAFTATPDAYRLEVVEPADWATTTPLPARVDAAAENASAQVDVGMARRADATVRLFDDADGDGTQDAGEAPLAGWEVQLDGRGSASSAVTGADGVALFEGVARGHYTASTAVPAGWAATQPMPVRVSVTPGSWDASMGVARVAGLSVRVFADGDGDGVRDPAERDLAGHRITLAGGPDGLRSELASVTDAGGVAEFDHPSADIVGLRPGRYVLADEDAANAACAAEASTLSLGGGGAPESLACADGAVATVLVGGTGQTVSLGLAAPAGVVTVTPFNDVNGDGAHGERHLRLVGWTARLFAADGATPVVPAGAASNAAVTGADGAASFAGLEPGRYVVRMTPRSASPAWSASTPAAVSVDVAAGGAAEATFGFVRRATVTASAFDDVDRDGVWDAGEEPLADRTVRLLRQSGALLRTARTDAGGQAAFKVTAGTTYRLEVLRPAGWKATGPRAAGGAISVRAAVKTTAKRSAEIRFGQARTVDAIAPAAPVATATGGVFGSWPTVSLEAESGARIQYTVNGSAPSKTAGKRYAGPLPITGSTTLRAVAIDAAGNVSPAVTETYFVVLPPAETTPAASWTTIAGRVAGGSAIMLGDDDAAYLSVASTRTAGQHVADGYGAVVLPEGRRDLAALMVELDARATVAGTRELSLLNQRTGAWEVLASAKQTTVDAATALVADGDAGRFVSAAGEIRLRVRVVAPAAFVLRIDRMAFTAASR